MAESQAVQRARTMTNVDSGIISVSDMTTLEETAKDEILSDIGSDVDFTTNRGRSALMWLLCLFIKIHIGDIGSGGYSIGDIEADTLDGEANIWFRNYLSARNTLRGEGVVRHAKPSRDGREYGDN